MCLLAVAWRRHPNWPVVLIVNRDERYDRPTAIAARWATDPHVLAGRDLEFGGTWLGVSEAGRLAAVTNFRDLSSPSPGLESRGVLTRRVLLGEWDLGALEAMDPLVFRPFNLLAFEGGEALYLTNRPAAHRRLQPGVHGVSNGPIDHPWPKTRLAMNALERWLSGDAADTLPLFAILADETPAGDADLPDTGLGLERERALSPCFLRGPVYGTRCSTVIRVDHQGGGEFIERSFGPGGVATGEVRLEFRWPVLGSG